MFLQILWVFDTKDKQRRYPTLDWSSICFQVLREMDSAIAPMEGTVNSCKI